MNIIHPHSDTNQLRERDAQPLQRQPATAMSSLAAARADNFYHPPDWDPRKESRADYNNKGPKWKAHPLRERAKKLDEGILVIRFEMPFDVRCSGCGCRIGKGVRFDAEKKAVGKYLSTKIWSFRMLCKAEQEGNSLCDQRRNPHFIEVRTDPKNAEYLVTEGAQILFQSTATAAELGVEAILDPTELAARTADPFYKLEAHAPQAAQAKARKAWLPALEEARGELWHSKVRRAVLAAVAGQPTARGALALGHGGPLGSRSRATAAWSPQCSPGGSPKRHSKALVWMMRLAIEAAEQLHGPAHLAVTVCTPGCNRMHSRL